jgi:hypothetical protein
MTSWQLEWLRYGNVEFNGLPALSNGYIVDGLETNDPFTNLSSSLSTNLVLGLNSISEVTVNTLSYSVDQGLGRVTRFRLFIGMGKIRGTPCMPSTLSYIVPLPISSAKSFSFKRSSEKGGLPRGSARALGAGGLRFNSGRPDQIAIIQQTTEARFWRCCIVVQLGNKKKNSPS